VGHSYAGIVVKGVADRVPGRVSRVVYLDAFVPQDGQSLFDFIPPERQAGLVAEAQAQADGWRLPSPPPDSPLFGVTDPDDVRWMIPRLAAQPLQTFTEPVRLTGSGASLPQTYIWCTRFGAPSPFGQFVARVRNDPSWRFRELASEHDAMITVPR